MKLKVFYNVESGGDGSAHANFYESEELALWHEEHDPFDEGWAESSVSWIEFESDSPITCVSRRDIETKEAYLLEHYIGPDEHPIWRKEFIEKFFPNGFPEYTTTIEEVPASSFNKDREYSNYTVFIDGKEIGSFWKERHHPAYEVLAKLAKDFSGTD